MREGERVLRLLVGVAGAALPCSAVHAQFAVVSGGTVNLGFFASVNPDCSSAGTPTVRITQQPRHGRVVVVRTRDFTSFSLSNPRSACNSRRVSGVSIRYISQRGYTGYDSLSGETFYQSGTYRSGTVNITVR
jgi:hypothetical protein